jgi:hypothetical protein
MRTIETKVYTFNELSEDAKQNAISNYREHLYLENDFARWAIDDCALLEPHDRELRELFGDDYKFPLIENNRKVYFSLDRDRHIDITEAAIITNDSQFLTWLGIPEQMHDNVYFTIKKDTIEFEENDYNYEFNEIEKEILVQSQLKFKQHCSEILERIESDIDYRCSDEAMIDDIISYDYEFTENGKIY